MLTILKDWRNASEDTAVERWKNLGMLENLDQEEAKKCAACFDLMGHWIVDNSETLKKYDSCKEFDNVVFPIIKGVIVNEGGFKEGFLPEKILITWQEAYAKNYYRFDDILADISAEVANKLGFHPYVDLGLPSGTKWAKINIGAEKETDSGLYFAWGETQGYSGNIESRWFDWYTYKYGMQSSLTKYNSTDGLTVLEPSDDAATVNWGGKWHMPTAEQIEELRDRHNCSGVWVTDYNKSGVNGILFTSERNGNQLFIPAVSNCISSLCTGKIGEFGYIWSSTLQTDDDKYAGRSLRISSCGIDKSCNLRCVGIPVRPVFE